MTKLLLLLGVILVYHTAESKNLLETIEGWPNLGQAAAIIREDKVLESILTTMGYTAFIPNDDAMNAYEGPKDSNLIRYHIANIAFRAEHLPDEINTELVGNPRLYVHRIPTGKTAIHGWEDNEYFINNAKIIDANGEATAEGGVQQIFHVVDQVIIPTIPQGPAEAIYKNPDARKVLEKPSLYGLVDENSITDFQRRVSELNLMDVFNMTGKNTFFIPTNQALNMVQSEKDLIDKQVIHGHIVPNKVQFTRTVQSSTDQSESLAFTDNLKVFISMENVTSNDGEMAYYVKSNTVAGDVSHDKGTVLARIIKGNIPVKNGVVHLIDRPLMVVASNVMSYLQEDHGQLSKFHQLMRDHYPDLTHTLVVEKDLTLFAPSNEAFTKVNSDRLDKIMLNKERLGKLLKLHVINRRLTTDEIVDRTTKEEETLSNQRKLYFSAANTEALVPTISLEGGGVNATITTPDIAAKNGVIHIINRILGIPSQTVYEKLSTDPMLSNTFELSEQNEWNERLNDRDETFTLFVPSNKAWDMINRTLPSAHKKLFMGEFSYHVRRILERHVIVGENFTIEELNALTTNSSAKTGLANKKLQMTRGKVYFQARVKSRAGEEEEEEEELATNDTHTQTDSEPAESEYYLEWNGLQARIIRPDLECVNGVVHVLDKVLMLNRDVTISGSSTPQSVTAVTALLTTMITIAFARAFHH